MKQQTFCVFVKSGKWILLLSIVTFILEKAIRSYIVSETIIFVLQLAPFILMAIAVILGIVLATNILIRY